MAPMQRHIVLYDGTWNDPADRTNVFRLARYILDRDAAGVTQRFKYDSGVGTEHGTLGKLFGGAFGVGLSQNLMEGYAWLAKSYREGDEIWIFGFSRGAYTARSLAGIIRKCGLLDIYTPKLLAEAYKLYRNTDEAPDGKAATTFRKNYSSEPDVHFLGVWDTVGALGIPGTAISEKGAYKWHDQQISKKVKHAYHAMALDEHRKSYDTTLWTTPDGKQKPENIAVEQCWFIGAHANVGGGYGDDLLADLPFDWMMQKARAAGLALRPFELAAHAHKATIADSFKKFLRGIYAGISGLFKPGDGRHYRGYFGPPQKDKSIAVNVTVHDSVWRRWKDDEKYRPPTLVRAGLKPPA
jgi:uncharacterized protein (DUF2235 family)